MALRDGQFSPLEEWAAPQGLPLAQRACLRPVRDSNGDSTRTHLPPPPMATWFPKKILEFRPFCPVCISLNVPVQQKLASLSEMAVSSFNQLWSTSTLSPLCPAATVCHKSQNSLLPVFVCSPAERASRGMVGWGGRLFARVGACRGLALTRPTLAKIFCGQIRCAVSFSPDVFS